MVVWSFKYSFFPAICQFVLFYLINIHIIQQCTFFIADNNTKNFINQNNRNSHANFKTEVCLQLHPPQSLKQIKTIKKFLNSLTKTYGVSQHHQKHLTSATGRIYKKDISLNSGPLQPSGNGLVVRRRWREDNKLY